MKHRNALASAVDELEGLGAYRIELTLAAGEYRVEAGVWRVWKPDGDGKGTWFHDEAPTMQEALERVLRQVKEEVARVR